MARIGAVLKFIGRSSKRIAITVAGFALVALGLALIPLPGPGLLVVIAGLAVLATEYAWARQALDEAKRRASQAAKKVRKRGRAARPSAQ